MSANVIDWLLEKNEPAVRYFTLVDLLDHKKNDREASTALSQIPRRGFAARLLKNQRKDGSWFSRSDLYLPKYNATNWRMIVLSDLGMDKRDERIRRGCEAFFDEWFKPDDKENVLRGGGELCISGNLARTLARCGYADDQRVKKLFDWIVEHQKEDGGWHCFPSNTGTLDCWEGLAAYAALPRQKWTRRIKRSAERGAEFYLERRLFREGSRRYAPWFRFHYPNHYYYDVLVGLDTITSIGYGGDKRLREATKILKSKRRADGRWNMDAVHPDLGPGASYHIRRKVEPLVLERAGAPSKLITLRALRVLNRIDE